MTVARPDRPGDRLAFGVAVDDGLEAGRPEALERQPRVAQGLDQAGGQEVGFPEHIDVEFGTGGEVGRLTGRLLRNVRPAHDGDHIRVELARDAEELKAERLVPHVVRQHQHIRRRFLERRQELVGIDEQAGVDLRIVPVHHRLHIGHAQRHAVVGENPCVRVAEIAQKHLDRHRSSPAQFAANRQATALVALVD